MPARIKQYNVGLLGFGRVLRVFAKHYLENKIEIAKRFGFSLKFIAIVDSKSFVSGNLDIKKLISSKEKGKSLNNIMKTPLEEITPLIRSKKLDILIDGIPGSRIDEGVSYPVLYNAVKNGVHLVCANKSPLVFKGEELFELSKKKRVYIGMSATTAGALPISGMINNELTSAGVYAVRGVLNGTSNFVLDKIMFESKTKLQAIQDAIKLGIAEPDYRFDLEGIDTCYKTVLLGLLLTGKCADLKSITCKGIMELDENEIIMHVMNGMVVRLIGNLLISEGKPIISVKPEILEKNDPLYGVYGSNKGVTFRTKYMGDLTLTGGASGLVAIGATITKDIINLHKFCCKK
ncbi:MAG: homoserine dehydrogenase [bacterium]